MNKTNPCDPDRVRTRTMNPFLKCEVQTYKTEIFPSVMVCLLVTYNGEDWHPLLLSHENTMKAIGTVYENWKASTGKDRLK